MICFLVVFFDKCRKMCVNAQIGGTEWGRGEKDERKTRFRNKLKLVKFFIQVCTMMRVCQRSCLQDVMFVTSTGSIERQVDCSTRCCVRSSNCSHNFILGREKSLVDIITYSTFSESRGTVQLADAFGR